MRARRLELRLLGSALAAAWGLAAVLVLLAYRPGGPLDLVLGVGSLLVLLPSIGSVLNQLRALGSQTLMPSLEAAYPWLLALAGTSLFAGFGLARRLDAGTALP